MRIIIFTIVSLVCAGSFAAKIDKTAVLWNDSKESFFGVQRQAHECEIKTDKNLFDVRRSITTFPRKKTPKGKDVCFWWDIAVIPNSQRNLSKEPHPDKCSLCIGFEKVTTNTYQISSIFVDAPGRKQLCKKRSETVIVGFGYSARQCKLLCDDLRYSIDPSVLKAFGKDADLMLNTRSFTIKYKNDKDKLVKGEYDLSELKSVFEIVQEEAKKFNEVIEFKFHTKADSNS